MKNSFVIKGNICQTVTPRELDLHEGAVYLGLDALGITAKFVAGRKIV